MARTGRSFSLAASAAALCLAAGCADGIGDLLTFEETVEQSITVPGSGIGVNNPLAPEDVFPIDFGDAMASQLQQSFETQNIQKELVASMTVSAMTMQVTNPDEAGNGRIVNSLEFLERLAFKVGNEDTAEANLVLVAESEDDAFLAQNVVSYTFPVTNNELADVLKGGDELIMDTEMETDPPPDDRPLTNCDILFSVTLSIEADPGGVL